MPEQIFVCYRHEDDWCQKFEDAIGRGFYKRDFELWIDERKIDAGQQWETAIDDAIAASRIALVLVSKGFKTSDFVERRELPLILARAKAGALDVVWVPIDDLGSEGFKRIGLDSMQAAWKPSNPLSKLAKPELDDALIHIGDTLSNRVKLLRTTSPGRLEDIKRQVISAIHDPKTVIGEPFAAGDYSIFFKAKRENEDFALKVLVPTPGRPWLSEDFMRRANLVSNVQNSTAIKIRNVFPHPSCPCVAMDFIPHPTLAVRLKEDIKLDPRLVADVLAQLVRLAGQLHTVDGRPIIGPVRPSHIHYDSGHQKKAFISLLPIVNETLATCLDNPTWLQDFEALPYLSPERYFGQPVDGWTDQYYLALLGLELLQGKPPVQVNSFADLKTKTKFFESPRSFFDEEFRLNQPGFSFVLAKMLERNPGKRWKSISELVGALQAIAQGKIPEAVKHYADNQYSRTLRKNPDFFRSFYEILFEQSKEISELFERRRAGIDEQSQKLNKAMASILNFNQQMRTSILEREVDHHRGMRIKPKHFTLFRDAFLQALRQTKITDGYSQDAWRAILDPALDYMKDKVGKART